SLSNISVLLRCNILYFLFFFSSRRRHTRCYRDWSSDVCSSDLFKLREGVMLKGEIVAGNKGQGPRLKTLETVDGRTLEGYARVRSEERRVGKECRCRWWADDYKKEEGRASEGEKTERK